MKIYRIHTELDNLPEPYQRAYALDVVYIDGSHPEGKYLGCYPPGDGRGFHHAIEFDDGTIDFYRRVEVYWPSQEAYDEYRLSRGYPTEPLPPENWHVPNALAKRNHCEPE